ncbi:hypothetical protein LSH36_1010g00072 [Paralvinella palmiformis]|uniref:Uncharacterized protein n=1 Tax=Paralvinella palmiformis TaxID=53620 RepID=A0AAD9MRZ5_9ANNE|nr:hypothetical protein LSH36_1010g00072 [Paralvinella palmiformis]
MPLEKLKDLHISDEVESLSDKIQLEKKMVEAKICIQTATNLDIEAECMSYIGRVYGEVLDQTNTAKDYLMHSIHLCESMTSQSFILQKRTGERDEVTERRKS